MTDLVDKVALAIWQEREKCFPARVQRMKPDDFDKANGAWEFARNEARAAIEAMREPTEEMTRKAHALVLSNLRHEEVYRHMIDAALTGGSST